MQYELRLAGLAIYIRCIACTLLFILICTNLEDFSTSTITDINSKIRPILCQCDHMCQQLQWISFAHACFISCMHFITVRFAGAARQVPAADPQVWHGADRPANGAAEGPLAGGAGQATPPLHRGGPLHRRRPARGPPPFSFLSCLFLFFTFFIQFFFAFITSIKKNALSISSMSVARLSMVE